MKTNTPGTVITTSDDLTDEEIEAVQDAACAEAEHAWWPGGIPANPYPAADVRAGIWATAFDSRFAKDWH